MIAWVSKEKQLAAKSINYKQLNENIAIIKKYKPNALSKYVISLFREYRKFLMNYVNNVELIDHNLKEKLKDKIIDCSSNTEAIKNCKLILSSSHENSYYSLKVLNKNRKSKILVICFDMHCDTYDYNDKLWKGNVFSKLLREEYINNLIVLGVPKKKYNMTKADIPIDLKEKVCLLSNCDIEQYLLEYKPDNVFISIDIDCFNTRKRKYTALEYSPATILKNISYLNFNDTSEKSVYEMLEQCIYVKNNLGYANLYKIGENKMSLFKVKKYIKKIKKSCYKNGINLGFNYKNHIVGEITELSGYDYGNLTTTLVIKLIKELI